MKISYRWLSHYIDIQETPEEIAQLLTQTGLEVESITPFETVKGSLEGVVIGEVLTCVQHPNADKLKLTTVSIGKENPLNIVCGAPNVQAGQKVLVATIGTTLYPLKGESFKIQKSKIRGEVSEGMLCAEDELGLGESHDGILVLNTNLPLGTPAASYFKLEKDWIFEIGLTPNRSDAMSHLGVARDLHAVLHRPLKWFQNNALPVKLHNNPIQVHIDNSKACYRYSGISLANVKVQRSPAWLETKLRSIGLTPINNIVDVTNYVLHSTGQPLHAFDADKIIGKKIIVKTLPDQTPFVTLDGKERKLSADDVMVCDERQGLCIGGVFGGLHSGITEHTKNVFLESACFSPDYIRRTSQRHQLKTDASFRFERGTDPEFTTNAIQKAVKLIVEMGAGEVASELIDSYPQKKPLTQILITYDYLYSLIGQPIEREEILKILARLDFSIKQTSEINLLVEVPSYRVEVTQPADVVEEILRIYGYNQVKLPEVASSPVIAPFPAKNSYAFKNQFSQLLTQQGFYEVIANSLIAKKQAEKLAERDSFVYLMNSLSEDASVMRPTLFFSGMEILAYNLNRKNKDVKIFEWGKVYRKNETAFEEEERLSLFITGGVPKSWLNAESDFSFFDVKKHTLQLIQKAGFKKIKTEEIANEFLAYGMRWMQGKTEIGFAGKVSEAWLDEWSIKQPVYFAELKTNVLFDASLPKVTYREIPKFPSVKRDLSLVLAKPIKFSDLERVIHSLNIAMIKDFHLFDVYEGKNLDADKKALALSFTLADEKKTLTDKEVDDAMNTVMQAMEKQVQAVIRK